MDDDMLRALRDRIEELRQAAVNYQNAITQMQLTSTRFDVLLPIMALNKGVALDAWAKEVDSLVEEGLRDILKEALGWTIQTE